MSEPESTLHFDRARVYALIEQIERLAGGDMAAALPVSVERGDELDAIAHAVNMLADELRWTSERKAEAERERVIEQFNRKSSRKSAVDSER
jgi:methyl-accepting chemotaxis protein